jgi:hypothetical protein
VNKTVLLAMTVTLAAAAPQAQQDRAPDVQKRRNQIQLMEGVLARAAGLGAEQVGRQLMQMEPGLMVLTGQARARGFVLEGYGVFFDVEIPGLRPSVLWTSKMMMEREQQLAQALAIMQRALESMPESAARQQAQQAFMRVQRQIGPVQQPIGQMPPGLGTVAPPAPGAVAAATTAEAPVASPHALDDPEALYTEVVKSELIDAMLDHGLPMNLGPDEWLTVAARDSEGPIRPGEIYDAVTIVLRIKGVDLATYAADRSRRDEIRSKVEVRVF